MNWQATSPCSMQRRGGPGRSSLTPVLWVSRWLLAGSSSDVRRYDSTPFLKPRNDYEIEHQGGRGALLSIASAVFLHRHSGLVRDPHQEAGLPPDPVPVDDLVALEPARDELRNDLGGILQVSIHADHRVASSMLDTRRVCRLRAEVSR